MSRAFPDDFNSLCHGFFHHHPRRPKFAAVFRVPVITGRQVIQRNGDHVAETFSAGTNSGVPRPVFQKSLQDRQHPALVRVSRRSACCAIGPSGCIRAPIRTFKTSRLSEKPHNHVPASYQETIAQNEYACRTTCTFKETGGRKNGSAVEICIFLIIEGHKGLCNRQ